MPALHADSLRVTPHRRGPQPPPAFDPRTRTGWTGTAAWTQADATRSARLSDADKLARRIETDRMWQQLELDRIRLEHLHHLEALVAGIEAELRARGALGSSVDISDLPDPRKSVRVARAAGRTQRGRSVEAASEAYRRRRRLSRAAPTTAAGPGGLMDLTKPLSNVATRARAGTQRKRSQGCSCSDHASHSRGYGALDRFLGRG